MVCAIASCAAPVSNKNTSTNTSSNAPLTQSTPIVYASNADDGSLQAISGSDGSPLWRTPVGHINSMPTIVGDTIYTIGFSAQTAKKTIVAVRLSDGKLLWRTVLPPSRVNPLLFTDGQNIIVDLELMGILGIDPADGSIRWTKQVNATLNDVLLHGVVYTVLRGAPHTADYDKLTLTAFGASDGKDLWSAPSDITSRLGANGALLFGNSGPHTTFALNPQNGRRIWTNETSGLFVGVTAQMAFVDDTYLTALSATTGQSLWRAQSGDFGFGSAWHDALAVANGLIYGGRSEELIALHERDGTEAWRVAFKGYLYVSQPVIHDGVLFVVLAPPSSSSSPRQIVALNAATGAIYWRLDVRDGQQLAVFSDAAS